MQPFLLIACLTVLLATPGFAAHDPAQRMIEAPAAQADPAMAEALAVVDQFSAALKSGDLRRAGALLAEDVLILESGGAERSRQEYLGGHAKHDAAFLKSAKIAVKHRTARVDGSFAWVGTESELTITKAGKPVRSLSTETMVLRKTGAAWRIVHIHWSSR